MQKLLVVHNFYQNFGGEDSNIYEEINFLSKEYEIEFFDAKNEANISFFSLLALFTRNNFRMNSKFLKILNNFKPDIVYIHNLWFTINLGIFPILKKKKVHTIVKIHNFRYECSRYLFSRTHLKGQLTCDACGFSKNTNLLFNKYFSESYLKSFFLYLFSKKLFNILKSYPLSIVAISIFHRSQLIKSGLNENKISIFHNPIKLNLDKNIKKSKYFVYAGRLSIEKGVEELILAWINSGLQDYQLLIIGEGELKNYLQSKYTNHNIKFLGFLPNNKVMEYIKSASAVISATKLYEGQPRLLCEASSFGTLSIYPSFGSMDEFFPNNYKFSFKQFDYEDLKNKIKLTQDFKTVKSSTDELLNFSKKIFDPSKFYYEFSKLIQNKDQK